MVTITPACVATDGVSLYVLAVDVKPTSSYNAKPNYVLVKSNPNPSPTLSDLSWTLVSSKPVDDSLNALSAPYSISDFICSMDPTTKAFMALSRRSTKPSSIIASDDTRGIRYVPDSDGGAGTWSNIGTSASYQWESSGDSSQLYNFKDGTTNTYMHAYVHSTLTRVFVAAMDTTTWTMNQNPASWTFVRSQ